ncbi:MAG: response regulator transcription factor [Acidimicrobiales bacterium]
MAGPGARLLVVEDDEHLARALSVSLGAAGYEVRTLHDGASLAEASEFHPDLAVLDVMLPNGPDGFAVARHMRALGVGVLFLTAADALEDRLAGFASGADDYLVKPFAMSELMARIRAVLRRSGRLTSPLIEVRDLVIDDANRVVTRGGKVVDLTPTEYSLLWTLAREPGRVFSKLQLLSLVWGFDQYDPNLVEVHVSSLRRKLGPFGPRLVHTERGRGYVVRA